MLLEVHKQFLFALTCYASPSPTQVYLSGLADIMAGAGTLQGDPLALLFFALVLHHLLLQCSAVQCSGGMCIACYKHMRDNLYVVVVEAQPSQEGACLHTRHPAAASGPPHPPLDAALDITVTHSLQEATRTGAATTPWFALNQAYAGKVAGAGELCRQEGLVFICLAAESLGGLHPTMVE